MGLTLDQVERITTRYSMPDIIERGVARTLQMPLWYADTLIVPTAGTLAIWRGSEEILAATAVTIPGTTGIAQYALPAATTVDLELSDTWQEIWTLTVTDEDGASHSREYRREAALVICRLHPVITDADLVRLHTELRDWQATDRASYQPFIDAAFDTIEGRLMELGNRPHLILSSYALRTAHIALTLSMVFLDYSTTAAGGADKYGEVAQKYADAFETAFGRISFKYDTDGTGKPTNSDRVNAAPVVFLGHPAAWSRTTGGEYL